MSYNFNEQKMNEYSVLANSAYMPNKKDKLNLLKEQNLSDRFQLIPEYTDSVHSLYKDLNTNNYILGIRGTDFENKNNSKYKDLFADGLLSLGLEKISGRYKRSDKMINRIKNNLMGEGPSGNKGGELILTGHSLGGTLTKDLAYKHNLESHSFQPGSTAMHLNNTKFLNLHPSAEKKRKRIHSYIVSKPDFISISSAFDPMSNVHILKPKDIETSGILNPHSIEHFYR